jgi:hypothetical protein
VSTEPLPDRAEALAILAALGGREPESVPEELGSLEVFSGARQP